MATAKTLRAHFTATRLRTTARSTRAHPDGHVVSIRALPDYDAIFGVDFHQQQDEGAQTS